MNDGDEQDKGRGMEMEDGGKESACMQEKKKLRLSLLSVCQPVKYTTQIHKGKHIERMGLCEIRLSLHRSALPTKAQL